MTGPGSTGGQTPPVGGEFSGYILGFAMSIRRFTDELADRLRRNPVPPRLRKEKELEIRFALPIVKRLAKRHTDVLLYVHPWGKKATCKPACLPAPPCDEGRVFGCPECWKNSKKEWSSVGAFGTHHTFDMAAIDSSRLTLAVELKLSRTRKGRLPSGDIQRFLGQCSLAATKHDSVLGLFVCQGKLDGRWRRDTKAAIEWFSSRRIHLVFREV